MKILIHLDSDTPLLCHEALSLAFALAAFEHEIVLYIGRAMFEQLIHDPHGKLANMVAAFELYDISSYQKHRAGNHNEQGQYLENIDQENVKASEIICK